MTTFVLVPGAGGVAWYWHRVVPLLRGAGHDAIAVDLPGDDPAAGLSAYADRVVATIGGRSDVVLVAQSLAGFTAPLVCERARVRMLVLVNAMIPTPGETPGEWGASTGSATARKAAAHSGGYSETFDDDTYFLHDVPPDVIADGEKHERPEAEEIFGNRCDFTAWPSVPIHVIAGRDDRLFPVDFQRRVARDRLGVEIDELPGGHLIALSYPRELADRLIGYLLTP
jgi:pimeloyl-ACP methyl ester carboxylesterase